MLFTPHLAPLSRGLLATCYAKPNGKVTTASLLSTLAGRYGGEPFVVVRPASPSTKATMGSNVAHITARYDERTEHRHRHLRDRQPGQGRLRWRGASRQRGARLGRNSRALHRRLVSVSGTAAADRAATLVEALPYIRRFADQVVVVKYGGNALAGASDDDALALFAQDIVLMRQVGMRPVVVHGGGPQISDLMTRLGKQSEFRNGLRVTDGETVDIVRMVLIGQVNPQLVAAINVHGPLAVGVSGEDAGLIRAVARDADLGFVGDVQSINPTILNALLDDEFIPVVATIGTDDEGQAFNINADTVAGAIAEALGAEKLVYLTDIEGLRRVVDDPASLIRQTTPDELDELMADGTIAGGMIPKVESCVQRGAQWRAPGPHPRRPHRTRSAAGDLHRRGDRDDGPMSSHTFDTSASPTLCPFMPVFGAPQVMFVRGSGTELWDSDGKRYLDFLGGLAVIALGHSNPRITEVIVRASRDADARQQPVRQRQGRRSGDQDQCAARAKRRARSARSSSATAAPRPTRRR